MRDGPVRGTGSPHRPAPGGRARTRGCVLGRPHPRSRLSEIRLPPRPGPPLRGPFAWGPHRIWCAGPKIKRGLPPSLRTRTTDSPPRGRPAQTLCRHRPSLGGFSHLPRCLPARLRRGASFRGRLCAFVHGPLHRFRKSCTATGTASFRPCRRNSAGLGSFSKPSQSPRDWPGPASYPNPRRFSFATASHRHHAGGLGRRSTRSRGLSSGVAGKSSGSDDPDSTCR